MLLSDPHRKGISPVRVFWPTPGEMREVRESFQLLLFLWPASREGIYDNWVLWGGPAFRQLMISGTQMPLAQKKSDVKVAYFRVSYPNSLEASHLSHEWFNHWVSLFILFFLSCWLFLLGFFLLINVPCLWFLVNEWMEKGGQWWRQYKILWREKYIRTACRSPQYLSHISRYHWKMIYEDCSWSVMTHSWVKWKK